MPNPIDPEAPDPASKRAGARRVLPTEARRGSELGARFRARFRAVRSRLAGWVRRLRRKPSTADALGRRGERAAVRALRRAGYRILATRFRCPGGEEVDVVALDGATLVVVEVKTSASPTAAPAGRVDHAKRTRLRAAVAHLLRRGSGPRRPVRLDVVEVRCEGRRLRARILQGHARLSSSDWRP